MSGVAAVQARIAEIQTRIGAVSPAPSTGADFAATMSAALATQAATGQSGSVLGASAGTGVLGLAGSTGLEGLGALTALEGTAGKGTGAALVDAATAYLGVPYVWGGEDVSGMDCSGLVQRAFADLGVDVPRVARDQMTIGTEVPSLAQARPGDLVVQRGGAHIGIYVGEGKMIHAPYPGEHVRIGDITTPPTTIRRVLPSGTAMPGAGASDVVDTARLALQLAGGSR